MNTSITAILIILATLSLGIAFGVGKAIGYNYFHNKTKKVCDLCFREIKKVNELYKNKPTTKSDNK